MAKQGKKKLIILDSHALIHRSFHALPPLTSGKEIVNAVYGFSSVLIKVIRELKPDYIAAAFDLPKPTFRHIEYKKYKAQRPKTPEELSRQIPIVRNVLEAFGIPIFEKEGYEADDLIGTIASKISKLPSKSVETLIVTGDLDTLQLVGPMTKVFTLRKGITDTIIYDAKSVKQRFGIEPKHLADYKGLRGDPSDNIPGVPGIGEKRASALLISYGSLENLFRDLKKEKGKWSKTKEITKNLRDKILEHEEEAFFSKKLAEIIKDVPINIDLNKLQWKNCDRKKITALFKQLGFRTLINRLDSIFESDKGNPKTDQHVSRIDVTEIKEAKDFNEIIKQTKKNREISIDLREGDGETLYLYSGKGLKVWSLRTNIIKDKIQERLREFLMDEKTFKIGFDIKKISKTLKFRIQEPYFDILISAYLLDPGRREYSLESLVFKYLNDELKGFNRLTHYPRLAEELSKKLKEAKLFDIFTKIDTPLAGVLFEMEKQGVLLDVEYLKKLSQEFGRELFRLEKTIFKLAGEKFNVNSSQQLGKILYEKIGVEGKIKKTPKGALSTSAAQLNLLRGSYKIVDFILRYRELQKLKSTYVDALPSLVDKKTKRLHTTFSQTITATGRLSSLNPNLQNIPIRTKTGRKIRKAFRAELGFEFISFDYSQIELRIFASLAHDKKMMKVFVDGDDVHKITASEVYNIEPEKVGKSLRRMAKVLNFGVLYGMSIQGFSEAAGVDRARAKEFIKNYFEKFSGIEKYIETVKESARKDGYVETMLGRRRYIPEILSPNWQLRQQAERMAVNMPIQGTAADIIKIAMINIKNEILDEQEEDSRDSIRLVLQIHDELLFEVKHNVNEKLVYKIKDIMENSFKLNVPIVVDIKRGSTWADL